MKNTKKVADQLLAVVGRIIDVGQNLNAVTSSMLDAADNAAVDARNLDRASDCRRICRSFGKVCSKGPAWPGPGKNLRVRHLHRTQEYPYLILDVRYEKVRDATQPILSFAATQTRQG
jgi:hypothetical protein